MTGQQASQLPSSRPPDGGRGCARLALDDRRTAVIGWHLKIRAGRMGLDVLPLIMGHEVAGEVAEVGSEVGECAPGDRVLVNFYVTCGRCQFCRDRGIR